MPTSSSLRIFGPLVLADGWQSFAPFMTTSSSFSCTFKFNSFGAPYGGLFVSGIDSGTTNGLGNPTIAGVNLDAQSIEFKWGPGLIYTYRTLQFGTAHFLAMTNNAAGVSKCWLDGVLVASGVFGSTGWMWANAQIAIGIFGGAGICDIQLQDLAMSGTYIWQDADIPQLFAQTKTAIQIDPSFSQWSLSGPIGTTPAFGDAGLNDQNARADNFVITYAGSLSNAVYAAPLVFTAPTIVTAQATKSGGLTAFVALGGGDGQPKQITAITQTPTINVQFGGTGSFHPIQTWGPIADIPDPNGGDHTWAHCVLQNICGQVASIVVQNGGSGYTSPSASISGGGGSGAFLGAPVLTKGVTAYTFAAGSGYNYVPIATVTGGGGWGAQPNITMTGGAISAVGVFWSGHDYTGLPTISLSTPGDPHRAVPPGGWTGSGASVTATTLSNVIRSIPVTSHGIGYTSRPGLAIFDTTGVGGTAVPIMSGIAPTDVVTWGGVTGGWLTATSGDAGTTTSASVENCSGRFETGLAGTPNFGSPPAGTLRVGWNQINFDGDFRAVSSATTPSWIKHVQIQQPSTADAGGRPILITANAGSPFILGFKYSITSNGIWTLVADELAPSTPLSVLLGCNGSYATLSTNIVAAGTPTTGVVSVTQGSMGSGYTDCPKVLITGGGASTPATAACRINSAGQVIGTWLVSPGFGYTAVPTITYTSVDGVGSGAASTCTIGPILSGKTWQSTVSGIPAKIDIADATSSVNLRLLIWNPIISSGTSLNCPYTLCNEFLFSPKETASVAPSFPSRLPKMRPSADMIEWLQTPSGNGPGILRWMNALYYGLGNSTVEAEDLKNFDDWWWFTPTNLGYTLQPTGPRIINVITMRTWRTSSTQTFPWSTPWVSPYVYRNEIGASGQANPTWSGYGSSGDTSGPFRINLDNVPTNQGMLNYGGSPSTNLYCCECVTDVPHNLKFGQLMQIQGGSTGTFNIGLDLSGGIDTHNAHDFSGLWFIPTGPTTFASVGFGVNQSTVGNATLFPGGIYNVAGSFSVSVQYLVSGFFNFADSPEGAAAGNGYFRNPSMHLCIPFMATDQCVKAIGRRVRDNMPVGSKVYTELGDENWNVGGQPWQGFFSWMAGSLQLYAPRYLNQNEAFAMRSVQVGQIVRDVYNETGRGGEVHTIVAGQHGNDFSALIPTVNASGLRCDAFSTAPYDQVPFNFPNTPGVNLATACASLYSHWPSSIAYQWPTPWTPAMWYDNWRYGLQYDTEIRRRFKMATNSIATYTGPGSPCEFNAYEGGFTYEVSYNIAARLDPDEKNLSITALSDLQYDPNMYDAFWTYFHSLERGGVNKISVLYLGDNANIFQNTIWINVGWQGQPAGRGDGSLCRDGRHIVNTSWVDDQQDHTFTNASVRLQASQDWQDAVAGAPVGSSNLTFNRFGVSSSASGGVSGAISHGHRRRFIAYRG